MDAQITVVTSTNREIWQEYAHKTIPDWQWTPWIHQEPDDSNTHWQEWRHRNRTRYPSPDFFKTWERFSHKVEAQCELSKRITTRYMIWLDADVQQIKTVPEEVLQQWLPQKGSALTFLSRGDLQYPETGFIAYDLEHPKTRLLLGELKTLYLSNEIFQLEQWHDGYVWDWLARQLKTPRQSLTPEPYHKGEAFDRSLLREYLRHHKGKRKQQL